MMGEMENSSFDSEIAAPCTFKAFKPFLTEYKKKLNNRKILMLHNFSNGYKVAIQTPYK